MYMQLLVGPDRVPLCRVPLLAVRPHRRDRWQPEFSSSLVCLRESLTQMPAFWIASPSSMMGYAEGCWMPREASPCRSNPWVSKPE